MADVDNRRDYRGGGGGGGGGGNFRQNKRKRFRDEDEFDHPRQRQRHGAPPPGTQIRRNLLEIGEDSLRLPHETASHTARLAADNYEDEFVKEVFCTVALKMVEEQPFKIPFVAATVLFAHGDKKEVAQDVVTAAGVALQEYLNKGQWRESKLILRFLACLSRLFESDGVLPILDELFNRAVDLQTASQEDVVGLELVKIILLTIPYLLAFTDDAALPQRAAELLEKTDIVASTPHQLEPMVDPYPAISDESEKPMVCPSLISLLQRQLQDEASNGWPLTLIPRIYDPSFQTQSHPATNGDAANGEANGTNSAKIAFPSITVPSPINPGNKTLFPEIFFSLYADQEVESVPSTSSIASSLLRDACVDTVNILDFNRQSAARYLNSIDCFWTNGTFVSRSTAFDKLRGIEPGRPTWKPEDVAIDSLFSQIVALPYPEHRLVYYHSVITEICRISPQAFAPSLGRAIRYLFRNLNAMDLELAYRYMDWFAHHLSNFEFRWKWQEWIPDLVLPPLDPKKSFINGVLDKEIRLSFAKRIRDTLPEDYHALIPASKEKDVPDSKFADDKIPFAAEGREVLALLKRKASDEELQTIFDRVQMQAEALGMDNETALAKCLDLYLTAILTIGSKSLSHVISTVDRCKPRIDAFTSDSALVRRQVISSITEFWHEHPGTAVNIIGKLLNYSIIKPENVVQWALVEHVGHGRALAQPMTYELVTMTMNKVLNSVNQAVDSRNNIAIPFPQRKIVDDMLPLEIQGMRNLFVNVEDALAGFATGAQDGMMEVFEGDEADVSYIRAWGARWARVWGRKRVVEDMIVREGMNVEMVEPAEVPLPGDGDGMDDGLGEEELDRID